MPRQVTRRKLQEDTERFRGTGGASAGNRQFGFRPAFLDTASGEIHEARYADGRPAPCHLLDGLPEELVARRNADGRVLALKPRVVVGFVRAGRFYTREEAAAQVGAMAA